MITANKGQFKKGMIPWNKGKQHLSNEDHPNWKGDNVGYSALHAWITRKLGRPSKCEVCGITSAKKYEWANLSGEYKRDFSDWKRMCLKCHQEFDGINILSLRRQPETMAKMKSFVNARERDLAGRFL